jgi:hypothetical protein
MHMGKPLDTGWESQWRPKQGMPLVGRLRESSNVGPVARALGTGGAVVARCEWVGRVIYRIVARQEESKINEQIASTDPEDRLYLDTRRELSNDRGHEIAGSSLKWQGR